MAIAAPPAAPSGARPLARRRPSDFGASGGGGRKFTPRRKVCQFCVDKIDEVDYKDLGRLRRFLSERGKIEPRRKTGTCAAHQRSLNVALKRARQLAMLPFTAEHIRITGVLVREPGMPPFRGARGPRPIEQEGEVETAEPEAGGAAREAGETTQAPSSPEPAASPAAVAASQFAQESRETAMTSPTAPGA